MASPVDSNGADDGSLTAYLDGELVADERARLEARLRTEPALQARLEALAGGDRPFKPAYEALLAVAPAVRLQAMLAGVVAKNSASERWSSGFQPRRLAAIAAALVIFFAGAGAGYLAPKLRPAEPPGWRQVVAEYYTLVTPETLTAIRADPAMVSEELVTIGERLALDLSPDRITLPDAALKRAQLYEFNGRPLVQLAYLSPEGPVALCIITSTRPDAAIAFEQREGSNIVFWNKGGHAFMLIGRSASREALEAYAGDLAARFS
jgi:anti-sigma factor RsiW